MTTSVFLIYRIDVLMFYQEKVIMYKKVSSGSVAWLTC